MTFTVNVSFDARQDLTELANYIAENDSVAMADHVLAKIGNLLESLAHNPNRGAHPPELAAVSNEDYREVFFTPYRIIYQVIGSEVSVLLISDGRRDMRALFNRRLLFP